MRGGGTQRIAALHAASEEAAASRDAACQAAAREAAAVRVAQEMAQQVEALRERERAAAAAAPAGNERPRPDARDQGGVDEAPAEGYCVLCLERLKNATLIHGDSGHVCCCLECASELKRRGQPCPICRKPISAVIRHFVS